MTYSNSRMYHIDYLRNGYNNFVQLYASTLEAKTFLTIIFQTHR